MSYKEIRTLIRNVAIAVVIIGVPLGMYMNFFVSNTQWSNKIMFVATLAIANWTNLSKFKFPLWSRGFTYILIFQLLSILYYFVTLDDSEYTKYLFFHLFAITLQLSLASNNKGNSNINTSSIIFITWILSSLLSIIALWAMRSGLIMNYSDDIVYIDPEERILEQFTMSSACVTNIAAALYFKKPNVWFRYISIATILLSLYCLFLLVKRTPIAISLFIILSYLYKHNILFKVFSLKNILFAFIAIVGTIWVFGNNEILVEQIERFHTSFVNGINDMLYGTDTSGGAGGNSAISRYRARQWAINYIGNEFNLFNYIFGAGYMKKWLDIPILQSYLDMGICGFLLFGYYVVYYPLKIAVSKLSKSDNIMFGCGLCYYSCLSTFNSGTPYTFHRWVPVIILICFITLYKYELIKIKK